VSKSKEKGAILGVFEDFQVGERGSPASGPKNWEDRTTNWLLHMISESALSNKEEIRS
jgi:hypothetical protein